MPHSVRLHTEVSVSVDEITRLLVAEGIRQLAPRFTDGAEPTGEEVLADYLAQFVKRTQAGAG